MTGDYIEELLELETKLFTHTFFWSHFTVSILSVGVGLEGKNQFFDTIRKDQNCILFFNFFMWWQP